MLLQGRVTVPSSRSCGPPQTRSRKPMHQCRSRTGRAEPFNEGAAQVKRLINRDRQEFLGNEEDILDKYREEFGPGKGDKAAQQEKAAPSTSNGASSNGSAASSSSEAAASPPSTAAPSSSGRSATASPAAPAAVKTSFRASAPATASPFGPVVISKKANIEPAGLKPDMSPDPIQKVAPLSGTWLSRITITQVVLFCTFSSMITLMLVTFYVVLKSGAVRLAGLD